MKGIANEPPERNPHGIVGRRKSGRNLHLQAVNFAKGRKQKARSLGPG
jgi:hypothetical protein